MPAFLTETGKQKYQSWLLLLSLFCEPEIKTYKRSNSGEKHFSELSILPAVDYDINAGVYYKKEMGNFHQNVTPKQI